MIYLLLALLLLFSSLAVGTLVFKGFSSQHVEFIIHSDYISRGIFLGVALIDLLELSYHSFHKLPFSHPPLPLLTVAVTFVALYALEWKSQVECPPGKLNKFPLVLLFCVLLFHSLLDGIVISLQTSWSIWILFAAVFVHKMAESLSFAHYLRASLSLSYALLLFSTFAFAAPLGVLLGNTLQVATRELPLARTILFGVGSGVLLYLATAAHTKHNHPHEERKTSYLLSFLAGFLVILLTVPFHQH